MNIQQAHLSLANNPATSASDYDLRIQIPLDKNYTSITFQDAGSGSSITRDLVVNLNTPGSTVSPTVETIDQTIVKGSGETQIRVTVKEHAGSRTTVVAEHTMKYVHAKDTALGSLSPGVLLHERTVPKDHLMEVIIPVTASYTVTGVTETVNGSERLFSLALATSTAPFSGDPLTHSFSIANFDEDTEEVVLRVVPGGSPNTKQGCQSVQIITKDFS